MGRGIGKNTGANSRAFTFRLYREPVRDAGGNIVSDVEAKAIDYLEAMMNEGYSSREVIASALVNAAGKTPTLYRKRGSVPQPSALDADEILEALEQDRRETETMLREFLAEIRQAMRGNGTGRRGADYDEPQADYEDDQDADKLIASFMARKNARR